MRLLFSIALLLVSMTFACDSHAQSTTLVVENPQPGARISGIGLVSGWTCRTGLIEVAFNGQARQRVPSGGARADTQSICGRSDTGFGLLVNFNLLGAGTHSAQLFVDGSPVGTPVSFAVTAPAGEFLRGAVRSIDVPNFPQVGQTTRLDWSEASQNFAIAGVTGTGFQALLDAFPIDFRQRIRILGVQFRASGSWCDATVRFQNIGTGVVTPYLYFDVVRGGVTVGQEIFNTSALSPGNIAEDTSSVLASGASAACGTFQLRFNAAASSIFDR